MNALGRYRALSPAERTILRRSLLLLPLAALFLRTLGLRTTQRTLTHLVFPGDGAAMAPADIARVVHAAARRLGIGCLARSVVLFRFLQGSGRVEIRFGVRASQMGRVAAHAWIELDGHPLGEGPDLFDRYEAFPPASRAWP